MQYFPQNTQSSYRTKLKSPLILDGSWEAGLTEIFIPRNWFNVNEHNNDYAVSCTIEKSISIRFSRFAIKFNYGVLIALGANVPLETFLKNLNENIRNTLNSVEGVKFIPRQNGNNIEIIVKKGYEIHITENLAPKMLQMFHLPNENTVIKQSTTVKFQALAENKQQLFFIVNNNPITVNHYLLPLTPIKPGFEKIDLFVAIEKNLIDLKLQNYVSFTYDKTKHEVEIHISEDVELQITLSKAPSLLHILNEMNDISITGTKKFRVVPPTTVHEGEAVEIIVKEYPKIKITEQEIQNLSITPGSYTSAQHFFNEFKHIHLKQLANCKVHLEIPMEHEVTFGRGLADMLGFVENHFKSGIYISDYPLELEAGITEIFVYTDLIESHHVGDTSAPLLRVIPCINEKNDQIVKHYEKPIYFPIRKNYVDTIEIELRTTAGKNITFMGGKTFVVLSFRRTKSIN